MFYERAKSESDDCIYTYIYNAYVEMKNQIKIS